MACFHRLILILFLSIPAFLPNTAFADYNKTLTRYKLNVFNSYYSTHTAACTAFVTAKQTAYPSEGIHQTSCTETTVQAQGWSAGATYYQSGITKYGSCNGVESEWGNGLCSGSCVAPQTLQPNGTCAVPPPPPCIAGEVIETGTTKDTPTVVIGCIDSCEVYVSVKPSIIDCSYGGTGVGTCYYVQPYDIKKTGNSCSSSSDPSPTPYTPTPDTCEQCKCMESGGAWGDFNGVATCVPQGSAGSKPVTYEGSTKTTTNTPAPTPENPNPTPTTSTSQAPQITINPSASGEPSVTETTTNADGSTTTTTQTKGAYCAEKPTAEICGGDGTGSKNSFGSDCAQGAANVQCDGDAIQCAIARRMYEDRCADLQTDSINELGDRLMTGQTTAADLGGTDKISNPVEINVGSIDTTAFLPKGCLSDMSFSLGSHSITLPLSQLCDGLQTAGKIVLAFAFMLAARIIFS